jgi:hypothetical protein
VLRVGILAMAVVGSSRHGVAAVLARAVRCELALLALGLGNQHRLVGFKLGKGHLAQVDTDRAGNGREFGVDIGRRAAGARLMLLLLLLLLLLLVADMLLGLLLLLMLLRLLLMMLQRLLLLMLLMLLCLLVLARLLLTRLLLLMAVEGLALRLLRRCALGVLALTDHLLLLLVLHLLLAVHKLVLLPLLLFELLLLVVLVRILLALVLSARGIARGTVGEGKPKTVATLRVALARPRRLLVGVLGKLPIDGRHGARIRRGRSPLLLRRGRRRLLLLRVKVLGGVARRRAIVPLLLVIAVLQGFAGGRRAALFGFCVVQDEPHCASAVARGAPPIARRRPRHRRVGGTLVGGGGALLVSTPGPGIARVSTAAADNGMLVCQVRGARSTRHGVGLLPRPRPASLLLDLGTRIAELLAQRSELTIAHIQRGFGRLERFRDSPMLRALALQLAVCVRRIRLMGQRNNDISSSVVGKKK